jgi:hypothetical protein
MDPGELLARVAEVLAGNSIPFFVTGSTATIAYGEPRFTNDIDISHGAAPRRDHTRRGNGRT